METMEIIQGFMKREQQEKIEKYRVLNETVKKGKFCLPVLH